MNKKKLIIIIVASGILILGAILLLQNISSMDSKVDNKYVEKEDNYSLEELTIVNEKSDSRVYAVSIDNVDSALPQAGINSSYLTYEVIVEGGLTRFLALFKDANLDKIGPVRSARHYFLDYAFENDAILVHYGQSYIAEEDIKTTKIENMNGVLVGQYFYRENDRQSPHNAYTSYNLITKYTKKYEQTKESDLLLNYSIADINLDNGEVANNVVINYPNNEVVYEYDSVNRLYNRFQNGKKQVDQLTGKQIFAENIIIQKVKNYNYTEGTVYQSLDNIGNGKGIYITNGKYKEITWKKNTRKGKTTYKYLDGKEIEVNDGKTFINIQPINYRYDIN